MCTVTFIPTANGILLTSNRDEKKRRQPALPPAVYKVGNVSLLYPKDGDKGGTWIGVNGKGNAAVLLNGAADPHLPNAKFTNSRGLVIPAILSATDARAAFNALYLEKTEPFTLILFYQKRLYQYRWDGRQKTAQELPARQSHIWSSVTLYAPHVRQKRRDWFKAWQAKNLSPDVEAVSAFHRFTGDGEPENDLVMNREGELLTVSITSLAIDAKEATMFYTDLPQQKRYRSALSFSGRKKAGKTDAWRRFFIRLRHWEYWPFHVVYAPIYGYYFWLSLKARSFFFFNAANPSIRNGGFLMESKKEIYDLLPRGTYPTTALVPAGRLAESDLPTLMQQHQLSFPLIAKPDIGLRGIGVKKIYAASELFTYHRQSKVDYLLQAFVPYTKEVGVFYYRFPGQKKGTITGIVKKELLKVKGNGIATVEELLQNEERFFLQLPTLRKQHGAALSEVPANGEERVMVPYGNHSRGAKFLDITSQLTPALDSMLNELCRSVPGFYFGRLDIKYAGWEDLCQGKNFSVIELNGAGSEPAHIYDPKHSLFFAWKEIIRHLGLLYRVSRQNKQLKKGAYLSADEGIKLFRANSDYMEKIA